MPWKEQTTVSLREEFVKAAGVARRDFSALCRAYGISRKTGYKWLSRFSEGGIEALADRSRRPHRSPRRTARAIEELVVAVRREHEAWGGRKIKAYLERGGHTGLPSPSTITTILGRYDLLDPEESRKHRPYQRFEMAEPNQLWQMDFKSPISLPGGHCHPLTILDDCTRFLVALIACPDETRATVQPCLSAAFREYGVPEGVLADYGNPWGYTPPHPHTGFTVWLLCLGVAVYHGRPRHPQTQGKAERFHRTLDEEVLQSAQPVSLDDCQNRFDRWRHIYNHERPHEALGMDVPADLYQASPRTFPQELPPIVYPPHALVRKVDVSGWISFCNYKVKIGRPFRGKPVALYPHLALPSTYDVFFLSEQIAQITLPDDTDD
jgi:transposase InsO family protein